MAKKYMANVIGFEMAIVRNFLCQTKYTRRPSGRWGDIQNIFGGFSAMQLADIDNQYLFRLFAQPFEPECNDGLRYISAH